MFMNGAQSPFLADLVVLLAAFTIIRLSITE